MIQQYCSRQGSNKKSIYDCRCMYICIYNTRLRLAEICATPHVSVPLRIIHGGKSQNLPQPCRSSVQQQYHKCELHYRCIELQQQQEQNRNMQRASYVTRARNQTHTRPIQLYYDSPLVCIIHTYELRTHTQQYWEHVLQVHTYVTAVLLFVLSYIYTYVLDTKNHRSSILLPVSLYQYNNSSICHIYDIIHKHHYCCTTDSSTGVYMSCIQHSRTIVPYTVICCCTIILYICMYTTYTAVYGFIPK